MKSIKMEVRVGKDRETVEVPLLACEGAIVDDFEDVLNEIAQAMPVLRDVSDRLLDAKATGEDLTREERTAMGYSLLYVLRHTEAVLDAGHRLYFAQRNGQEG
jgi:hypothetical protein